MHMRPVTVLEVVRQVSSLLWPYLFGKQPDSLQRDDEVWICCIRDAPACASALADSLPMLQNEGTFYLIENTPKFTKFMSEPIRAQQVSSPLDTPGYFVAGIVKGYLVSSGFPAEYAPPPSLPRTFTWSRPLDAGSLMCCVHSHTSAMGHCK